MGRGLFCKVVALAMSVALALSPAFVKAQETQAPSPNTQSQGQSPSQNAPDATLPDQSPARQIILGSDYSSGRKLSPNLLPQYRSQDIPEAPLTNSQRIAQLIQDGKLMLSLPDAVSLALE